MASSFEPRRLPTLADVEQAARAIAGAVADTPFMLSETLSASAGCKLYLKFENLQFTASFKERGALNKLLSLSAAERAAGVCAMSAGNHAQGVAYHAHRLGIAATIVMPEGTPLTKISRTRDHGANVIVHGSNLNAALTLANELAERDGMTFVHPYADPAVIAGQGTLALEMLGAVPSLDVIVVPVGGGGLISGIAVAAKAIKPSIRIIGVQSEVYPSMACAMAGTQPPAADRLTIAEGIAVKEAHPYTREIVSRFVDEVLVVEEAAIERAIADLLAIEKTVAEGAGAAALAGVMSNRERFRGLNVAVPLSGGNIDLRVLASVAMRALVRGGQLMRFSIAVNDQPGTLARLATLLGQLGANIIEIMHDRLALSSSPKGAVIDVVVEVQDHTHRAVIVERLREEGFTPTLWQDAV